ncbi:CRISPR-associated protein [Evansella caseinilytica]|uniref:CRISPR-associated protein n=1 Tax=Evansella caseinilytica TaxID=1503961 RepID=A0A1H3SND5_9BACI|nr:TIGR03986 family CRISPR-associated RAMP protein [Evansella caseinilytica]SDZ39603.1 CRISPR-associated protein [Evansella caseinilytica]
MTHNKSQERFVNPYNFVPLEEKCERQEFKQGTLTGYLECTLETLTPLFIPNTSYNHALHKEKEPKDGDHLSYNFYSYENLSHSGVKKDALYRPVIPGSEIRGAIRSVFEAAFNGCLSQVNQNKTLHRRSMQPKKPALLRKTQNGWEIKECYRIILNTDPRNKNKIGKYGTFIDIKKLKEGQVLYFSEMNKHKKRPTIKHIITDEIKPKKGFWKTGYVHIGEPCDTKYHESLFVPKNNKVWELIDNQEIELLKKVLDKYNMNNKDDNEHAGYKEYRKIFYNLMDREPIEEEKDIFIPVYYSEIKNEKRFFSPAMLSQEVFNNTVGDLLRENGGYQPCESRDLVCPSCALFGLISKQTGQSLASRIRFADATITDTNDIYMKPIVLDELGEPKPGTVEFYTIMPDGLKGKQKKYWTYDYTKEGSKSFDLDPKKLRVRGRKFYWHHEPKYLENSKLKRMRQRIRPLKDGATFTFRVYFEQIAEDELKQLQWALDFNDLSSAHKIGRGKPLGFGSVKVTIKKLMLRQIDKNSGSWILKDQSIEKYRMEHSTKSMENVLKITRFENGLEDKISYPKVTPTDYAKSKPNDAASHQWFNKNSNNRKDFSQVLPTIEEELDEKDKRNKWLKVLKK